MKTYSVLFALGLLAATAAQAQIGSINGAWIDPRVFNDIPGATFTSNNSYPGSVTLSEANVTATNKFANRDIWYYSNNGGASAYQFNAADYFTATFNVTLTGNMAPNEDLEAGFIFSNPGGQFGGDCQVIVNAAGVVAQFGGPSYYAFSPAAGGFPSPGGGGSTPNYTLGSSYSMKFIYTVDPANGKPAFEYAVNGVYATTSFNQPYFDLAAPVGMSGDWLGGYLQIQRDSTHANSGQAVFSNITMGPAPVPEPCALGLMALGLLPLVRVLRRARA